MSLVHIDAGHGGNDGGASANGFLEKTLTLEASLYQERRFKELGIPVSMTRRTDVNYTSVPRSRIVRQSGAKVCISNHFNAGGGRGAETIHSIFSDGKHAQMIADAIKDAGMPIRRVFTRKHNGGDYYYMHRMTGNVATVIVEYGFLDNATDVKQLRNKSFRYKLYEAVVKATCGYLGKKYVAPNGKEEEVIQDTNPKPEEIETEIEEVAGNYAGYRLVSKVDKLRYYDNPSWEDTDFFGYLSKGIGFPTVVRKVKVDGYFQYEVKNSKGATFYVTAADKYVELVPKKSEPKPIPKPSYVGKRLESKYNGKLRFYSKPSWSDRHVAGHITKGYGFPTIVRRVKVDGAYQYEVKNSKGATFFITASSKFVTVK